jgi:hypothetical protein
LFFPFGLNKFIYPGLIFEGEFLALGLTTLTVDSTYNSLAKALLTSGDNPVDTMPLETGDLTLLGDFYASYC